MRKLAACFFALVLVVSLAVPALAMGATLTVAVQPGSRLGGMQLSNLFPRLVEVYGANGYYRSARMTARSPLETYGATFIGVPKGPVRARVRWIGSYKDRSYYGNPWPWFWSSSSQTVYISPDGPNN